MRSPIKLSKTFAAVGIAVMLGIAGSSYGETPPAGHDNTSHAANDHGEAAGDAAHDAAHDGGHGDSPSLFSGDVGNVVWTLITFFVVLAVLMKFAWPPILNGLQKREEFIRNSLEEAREHREEAQTKLRQYEEQIRHAKEEATAIVAEGRRDAEEVKRKIQDETRAESDAMVERAKREVALARDTAVKELYDLAANLATDMASRVIRKELNAGEHERLIRESIDELEKMGAAGRG
jgi:F-type H+-transporting ATPase subunit b